MNKLFPLLRQLLVRDNSSSLVILMASSKLCKYYQKVTFSIYQHEVKSLAAQKLVSRASEPFSVYLTHPGGVSL